MKKRTLAILMILVLATSGLFAAVTITEPADVTATLKANIGEYLNHGFLVNSVPYTQFVVIEDAFGATAPSFTYGYKTNAEGTLTFKMQVNNFKNTTTNVATDIIKIASVEKDSVAFSTNDLVGGYYTIFTENNATVTESMHSAQAVIKIIPAKAMGTDHTGDAIAANEHAGAGNTAAPGAYAADIVFSITVAS
jgi:hypothetical protein